MFFWRFLWAAIIEKLRALNQLSCLALPCSHVSVVQYVVYWDKHYFQFHFSLFWMKSLLRNRFPHLWERRKWTSASVNKPDLEIHCIYTKVIYHINLEHRNRMKYKSWLTEINKWGRDRVRGKKNLAFTKQEMARRRGKTFKEKWTKEQTVKKKSSQYWT